MSPGTILLWRFEETIRDIRLPHMCSYCAGPTVFERTAEANRVDGEKTWLSSRCRLCGWHGVAFENPRGGFGWIGDPPWARQSVLREFDINSAEVTIGEVGTHLKRKFSDIYYLDDRRFEILVADAFKNLGHHPILTQQTHDGGVDIFLVNIETEFIDCVVEVKRYGDRKVGIEAVQRLAGVALEWQAGRALLITTSSFSSPAQASAARVTAGGVVGIDLAGAHEVLQLLGVYNENIPPLQHLTEDVRMQIQEANGDL